MDAGSDNKLAVLLKEFGHFQCRCANKIVGKTDRCVPRPTNIAISHLTINNGATRYT
jgi:hypothetical protein